VINSKEVIIKIVTYKILIFKNRLLSVCGRTISKVVRIKIVKIKYFIKLILFIIIFDKSKEIIIFHI
jgi:hypothetical protein